MFNALFYKPLYNALIQITTYVPGHYLVVAIIVLTLIVKLVLFPLSKRAVVTQMKMKVLEPEFSALREKYKGKEDRPKLAEETLKLYRKNELNPFSTFFLALLQIPIFIALALMFSKNALATVDLSQLYSFVTAPAFINQYLFWIDISQKNVILGAIAGILQFVQIRLSLPAYVAPEKGKATFKDDLAKSMNVQMRYVLPVIVFIASLGFSAALAIYWITSTVFTIGQELYFRGTIKKKTN